MNSNSSASPIFTGVIPKHYDQYLGPMFFEEYAIDISNRIDPSSVQFALELCCGTGRVTNHIRKVLTSTAKLVASDISPDMLAVAKEKLKTSNIDWRIIDAQQIPFEDSSLDLVVCCFGYMLVQDRSKAFAEAFRVLHPGGTLLLSTWDKLEFNEASNVFRRTVKKYFGDSLPETYKLPFSMNDPLLIKQQLHHVGFSKVNAAVVEKNSICATAKEATYGLVQGGSLYNEIIKRNPAWLEEITATVENELAEKYGNAPMVAPMRAIICQAWK
jgi:ubiquinone/menaquinone biosynthesis C-methylase UbiE